MSNVYKYTAQKYRYNNSGTNIDGQCSKNDIVGRWCKAPRWVFGTENCDGTLPRQICSDFNPSVCWNSTEDMKKPILKDAVISGNPFPNTGMKHGKPGVPDKVECVYDIKKINTLEKIIEYGKMYGTSSDDYNDIMYHFCSSPTTLCYNGKICTQIQNTEEAGNICRNWYNNLSSPYKDTVISKICTEHPEYAECECANRTKNDIYNIITPVNSINDACWWAPCTKPNKLIPSDVSTPNCTTSMCEKSIVIDNTKHDVNPDDIKKYIICGKSILPSTPKQNPESKNTKIVISVIIIVIILLILTIVMILKK